jgi:hypothetical protein
MHPAYVGLKQLDHRLAFLRTRPRTQFKTGPKALFRGAVRRDAEDRHVRLEPQKPQASHRTKQK